MSWKMKSGGNWGRLGMKSNWNTTLLGKVMTLKRGYDLPSKSRIPGEIPIFSSSGINGTNNKPMCLPPGVITGRYGTIGRVFFSTKPYWPLNTTLYVEDFKSNDPKFIYYFLKTVHWEQFSAKSAVPGINRNDVHHLEVLWPPIKEQKKIAAILTAFDDKIELNQTINDNLQQQAMLIYRQIFTEKENTDRRECHIDEYFDISIGKTPPRKEPQWFSKNPDDCVWVSISDMGSCGLFISDSSEYLTHEAVEKFNVKVVPDNTVLLSFKLTVGRVAITDGSMTTNEAIAHFKTDKPEINEYLYCYLKGFNYQTMGSTSSIATAVNSKIIKGMPFIIPSEDELATFHRFAAPLFSMIKMNQRENVYLSALRDTLLPRLMSGEIDVHTIQI